MTLNIKTLITSLAIILTALTPGIVSSEAYCALRDPVESINQLYPESKTYRSIVRVIDQDVRANVSKLIPSNTLHFSELGRHTLYVIFDDKAAPTGFVHVRSEESDWGLVEVAWALDLNMKIVDFRFQRSRSMHKETLQSQDFKTQFIGKNFEELSPFLSKDGIHINQKKLQVPHDAASLAAAVVRSGLKTLLVTQLAWEKEVNQYRLWQSANDYFDEIDDIKIIASPVTGLVIEALDNAFDGISTGINHDAVTVAKVIGKRGKVIGALYRGQFNDGHKTVDIEWAIAPNNTILGIRNIAGWQADSDKNVFEKVVGNHFNSATQCNNLAELMTLEAIITSKVVFSPK